MARVSKIDCNLTFVRTQFAVRLAIQMTIWNRFSTFVSDTASNALGSMVEGVRTVFEGDPETRRSVAFSMAMIALSAKMAKADGVVTEDEIAAFQDIFRVPDAEQKQVQMVYNLAKQDVAGFDAYAKQLAELCGSGMPDCPNLRDILDGLFHIAKADGVIHEAELAFLTEVAGIFSLSDNEFDRILARHVDQGQYDPWRVLGLERDASHSDARKHYLKLVRENHPDSMAARDLPEEFLAIAHERIATINAAWEQIEPELKRH